MKYITRWALMRCMRQESLSEHTADTALLSHALCLIARNITHTGADIRPDTVAAAALYHDAPEILTGDMPTPVKYKHRLQSRGTGKRPCHGGSAAAGAA